MKKCLTLFFAMSIVVSGGAMKVYAQSKGHTPIAPQGRSQTKDLTPPAKDKEAGKQTAGVKKDNEDAKIIEHIDHNPQLKARVQHLLPANMTLSDAVKGFHNQGQFIAALHVANNLKIPFTQLQSKVTGDPPMPLGKAVRELSPKLTEKQATDAVKTAEKQAKETAETKPTT
jgi:hypothetical protein